MSSSSQGARPPIRGSPCPVPKFQPRASGGGWGGDKGGAGSARRAGRGLEAGPGSPHGCWAGGRRARGLAAPGAPRAGGSGLGAGAGLGSVSPRVPPHRVRLPGGNVERAGRVLGRLPPLGV